MTPAQLQIGPVPPAAWADALGLIFQGMSEPQLQNQVARLLAAFHSGKNSPAGLLEGRCRGELLGAIWVQVLPGRSATIWPPRLGAGQAVAVAHNLLEAAVGFASGSGVQIAQALLEPDAPTDAGHFRHAGFAHLTDLLYLACSDSGFPESLPAGPLEFEAYAGDEDRLAAVVSRTYEGTRDCPALNGMRDIHDVLAGYKAAGEFDPSRWLIVRDGGADMGCLLLAMHPADRICELVYMGLAPEARGRGWGLAIARHAQWIARASQAAALMLGVDAENRPALRTYAAARLVPWDRRRVFIRVLGPGGDVG
jgi:ribosomal protein S18 acetylase RimI-like enzyme